MHAKAGRVIYTKDACEEPKETFRFRITKNTHKIGTNVCIHLHTLWEGLNEVISLHTVKIIITSYQLLNEVKRNGRSGMHTTDNIF